MPNFSSRVVAVASLVFLLASVAGQASASPTLGEPASPEVRAVVSDAVAVAAGSSHACAITTSGTVVCWGDNNSGQLGNGTTAPSSGPVQVTGLWTTAVALSAGESHTCAILADGALLCWGVNSTGQLGDGSRMYRTTPTMVTGLGSDVVGVAAGQNHTCAVRYGGVLCWGDNTYGEIGDSTVDMRLTPTPVEGYVPNGGANVTAVASGTDFSCARTGAGALVCWGRNDSGQLGNGTTAMQWVPVGVHGLSTGVASVTAKGMHTCALTTGAVAYCWGQNIGGALGDGSGSNQNTPVPVVGLAAGTKAVVAADYHTCALTAANGVVCWGYNMFGQLGDGTLTSSSSPAQVVGLTSGVAVVAGGESHTCALLTNQTIKCWGFNAAGQIGDGRSRYRVGPVAVPALTSSVKGIFAAESHSCALKTNGALVCVGFNNQGELGDGTTVWTSTPTTVTGLPGSVTTVAARGRHTCAITAGGVLSCWGNNSYGEIGNGTTSVALTPVTVIGSGVSQAAAGDSHMCAVVSGALKCWGWNDAGQLGDGSTTNRTTPTAVNGLGPGVAKAGAGEHHTCAVTTLGAVLCWGKNDFGQLGDGTTINHPTPTAVTGLSSGVAAVVAGDSHTCALTTGGAVLCWGFNGEGELGDGSGSDQHTPVPVSGLSANVTAISSGANHMCALLSNSTVYCWGANWASQLGDGTQVNATTPILVPGRFGSTATAVSAGQSHTCVLTNTGLVACWGDNYYGQLGTGEVLYSTAPAPVCGFGASLALAQVSPTSGSTKGGGMVTLSGSYFLQGAQVFVGGTAATDVAVSNPNSLTATIPPHGAGKVDVGIVNPDGQVGLSPQAFTYVGSITFTDEPIIARTTTVKLVHLTELRQFINELRNRVSLGAFVWTDATPVAHVSAVKAVDVVEMRTALADVYGKMTLTPPTYTHTILFPGATKVTAVDIAELRAAVLSIY
jgi:alpha-tubulin suppressor-like RCC1 family protein